MASRDYICCSECGEKIIYDGGDNGRERLEEYWGDPKESYWTVGLVCPECQKKKDKELADLRADVERLRAENTNLESTIIHDGEMMAQMAADARLWAMVLDCEITGAEWDRSRIFLSLKTSISGVRIGSTLREFLTQKAAGCGEGEE